MAGLTDLTFKINALKNSGKSKDEIYLTLLQQKYSVDSINQAFQRHDIHAKNKPLTEQEKAESHKKTVNLILTIGAVLIGAGVFSFIAANWSEMLKTIKISIIMFFMLTFYITGYYMVVKTAYQKTGLSLINIGAIIYGSGIFLIGQMFNVQTEWANGFILWMLGVLPLALTLNSKWLLVFGFLVGIPGFVFPIIQIVFAYSLRNLFNAPGITPSIPTLLLLFITALFCCYTGIWVNKHTLNGDH